MIWYRVQHCNRVLYSAVSFPSTVTLAVYSESPAPLSSTILSNAEWQMICMYLIKNIFTALDFTFPFVTEMFEYRIPFKTQNQN